MDTHKFTDEQISENIRSMLDRRTELARQAAITFRDLQTAKKSYEEARNTYSIAFNNAIKGGWKSTELTNQLGLATPEKKTRHQRNPKQNQ